MVTSVSNTTSASAVSATPPIAQIRAELTAALIAAGVTDAKATDSTPKGFPKDVNWTDAYKMVTKRVEDNNPSTPGTLVLSADMLKKALAGTKTLAELGVTSLARYPRGTTVQGALDQLFMNKSNGVLSSALAKGGVYDLSAFPTGTTAYQAFKLIEDPDNPGKVSTARYAEYKDAYAALTSLGITTLQNFPRASTTIDAKNLLEPKADLMLNMVGVDKSLFKDPNVSSLNALALLTRLPDTINQLNELPAGMTSSGLAAQALAAKKLVAMGYDDLSAFATMSAFKGSGTTATAGTTANAANALTAVAALQQVTRSPKAADLPLPTSTSTERYFQSTVVTEKKSYGSPVRITKTVLTKPPGERVTPNVLPPTKLVTAAEVLAQNVAYWTKKTV